jgi:hypothetical protein
MQALKQMLLSAALATAVAMVLLFVFRAGVIPRAHAPVDSLEKRLNAALAKTV